MKYAYEVIYQGNGGHGLHKDPIFKARDGATEYMRKVEKPVGIRSNPMVRRVTVTEKKYATAQ